jgi:hypothetical protein
MDYATSTGKTSHRGGGWWKTYGRNLGRKIHALDQGQLALLDGTLEVDVADLLAQVGLGADKANQAVLDRQQHVCALLDSLIHDAAGLDDEFLATVSLQDGLVKLHTLSGSERCEKRCQVGQRKSYARRA